jgi:hypothetical protein
MSDSNQKSYLRDSSGPRAVDGNKTRSSSRRDDDKQRKHPSSSSSSSRKTSDSKATPHHRKSSTASSPDRPTYELDIIGQPSKNIIYGQLVETSVMVSLKCASPEMVEHYRNMDTSRLMGFVSLIADARSGERVPVECGSLTGQQMFDSVHDVPAHVAESLGRSQPSRLALGYFNFPSLLIRQPGAYRLRITLIKMGGPGSSSQGGSSLLAIDSDTVKVERPRTSGNATARKPGRS